MKSNGNAWRKANPEKARASAIGWMKKNPERMILIRLRCRAKKLGVPFNLSAEDVRVPARCPVLGIPIVVRSYCGGSTKSNATIAELESVISYMRRGAA